MARAIAITSGKGGVGKTNAATNIGVALSRLGRRVCIFDADLGLANVNILTGQTPTRTLEDLVDGSCTINELIMEGPGGIHVVPSGSGVEKLAGLSPESVGTLKAALEELEASHDYLIIDTAAGLGADVLGFVRAAHEAVVVVSPEPTSMTDAYALVKVLHRQGFTKNFSILVNMTSGEEEGKRIFASFNNASKKFLGRELYHLGHVVRDYALASSVLKQTPVTVLYPESAASQCFARIALTLDAGFGPNGVGAFSGAWTSSLAAQPLRTQPPEATEPAPDGPGNLETLQKWLESGRTKEEEARELLSKLESSFMQRFGKPYADFRAGLYNLLDFSDVSSGAVKEAALLLESIHERRFGRPLFDAEDAMLKALSSCDSEARMQNLITTLENGFSRRYARKPATLETRLSREAEEGLLNLERITGLFAELDREHKKITGEPLKPEGMISATELSALLARFGEGETKIRQLASDLEMLALDREELLKKIRELSGS